MVIFKLFIGGFGAVLKDALGLNSSLWYGAVAQLGEYNTGSVGVRGSTPLSSTINHHPRGIIFK